MSDQPTNKKSNFAFLNWPKDVLFNISFLAFVVGAVGMNTISGIRISPFIYLAQESAVELNLWAKSAYGSAYQLGSNAFTYYSFDTIFALGLLGLHIFFFRRLGFTKWWIYALPILAFLSDVSEWPLHQHAPAKTFALVGGLKILLLAVVWLIIIYHYLQKLLNWIK